MSEQAQQDPSQADNQQDNLAPDSPEYMEQMTLFAAQSDPTIIPPQFEGDAAKYAASIKELRADHTRKSQRLAELERQVNESQDNREEADQAGSESDQSTSTDGKSGIFNQEDGEGSDSTVDSSSSGDDSSSSSESDSSPISVTQLRSEYQSDEGWSDRTKAILGEETLEHFVSLENQSMELAAYKAAELLGGKDKLGEAIEWAKTNLSTEELAQIDQDLTNPDRFKITVLGIAAQAGINTVTPNEGAPNPEGSNKVSGVVQGQTASVGPFRTPQEMQAAIDDPRYQNNTDPDYVATVQERLRKTYHVKQRS